MLIWIITCVGKERNNCELYNYDLRNYLEILVQQRKVLDFQRKNGEIDFVFGIGYDMMKPGLDDRNR